MTSISSSTPLVSVQDVTACIALMRCIHKLQEDLQLGERKPPIPDALKSLSHSVMRFGVWLTTRRDSQANLSALDQIPPLDVLMVWHTYMLMPITYWIDSQQSLPILALLGGIPWENLLKCINAETHDFTATSGQRHTWVESTSLPYIPDMTQEPVDTVSGAPRFSVDLVNAIVAQSSRISTMLRVVDGQKGDTTWIDDAIAEYPLFMQQTSASPSVPVDIVWHTHQLAGTVYDDDCKKHWGRIQGHDSSGDDQSGGSGFQGGGSGQGSGPTPNIGEGCSLEVYILFGPRNWTNEPPLIIQFLLLVDALPITDFQKSEFRNVSSIRYFNPSIVRYNHRPGKQFVLVGYLSYATAKDFVEAWREYGEKDVVAVILGRE